MKPTISTPSALTPSQPAAHEKQDKEDGASQAHRPAPVRVDSDTLAYNGLHNFFGTGKKINGQTHPERVLSAARDKDIDKLKAMIEPGAEGTDSLRKMTTAAGSIIGVKYDAQLNGAISEEAERNSRHLEPLMQRYRAGTLDLPGKRQLIQALACRAYTLPVLDTADGRVVPFGKLGNAATWDGMTREDVARSDIAGPLATAMADLRQAYEIAASFPQNKPAASPAQYSQKAKGLRKLWQETRKGNFASEAKRQAGKFNHRLASFLDARSYAESTLDEIFAFELRGLQAADRESIAKKIIENQVLATIRDLERQSAGSISPGKIAKVIKQKKNYRSLAYGDKDAYLAACIDKARTKAPAPASVLPALPAAPAPAAPRPAQAGQQAAASRPAPRPTLGEEDRAYLDGSKDLQAALGDWLAYQRNET